MAATIVLALYCARNADDTVDVEATVAKFRGEVLNFVAERDIEGAVIGDAINALFTKYPGARLVVPFVQSKVFVALNGQPENSTALNKRILDFIHENSGDRESGALLGIGKGKGSGVCRWSTTPVKEEKAAKSAK